ncbi:MMPL family transporter [Rheinheimera baltica]|uniref:MMPL family transporter n=1 Tax=Rheinheimera baltica TaxID=67576 RepID=A0ABT9I512_9GAMM|nr:MMPL family transporter [Rheinheimera baltica]MDP5138479.1 MMPL family transporter [Rheinheimera baltica]MDP5141918.1 MMPL family transporter [Rheinheimera baltica]MDP5150094.1 MMPL family transporter [Rheinheimera baltica]
MTTSASHSSNTPVSNWLAQRILQLRIAILLLFAVLLAAAAVFVPQFRIDASADTLLVKNNALYIKTQQANQRFSPDEFILVAYKPRNGEIFSSTTFTDLTWLREQYLALSRVQSVTSILTVPLLSDASVLTSDADVAELTWQKQQFSPQQMQQMLSDHPIFTDLLINKAQTATALQIVFKPDPELGALEQEILAVQQNSLQRPLTAEEEQKLEQLQQQADPLRQALVKQRQQELQQISHINQQVAQQAETFTGGAYVVAQHLVDIISSDLTVFGSAITGIIAVLLLLLYRSIRWVVFPLLACAASVWLTLGLFAVLDIRATVISANFIALQLILTLAVMIHLIGAYRDIARNNSAASQQQRVVMTLQQKLAPCFYAAVTTSVGFGSLLFSGIQPVVDFGFMMLIAMLLTMSVSLLLFPALLSLLKATPETADYAIFHHVLQAIRHRVARAPLGTVFVGVALFAMLLPGLAQLNVENSFINYFAKDTQVYRELKFIDQEFGGSTPLDIVITLDPAKAKADLLLSAEQFNQLHLAHAVVAEFAASGNVTSLVNFTTLATQLNDDKPLTEYELNSIYLLLEQKVVNQLVGAYLAEQPLQVRIATRIKDTTEGLNRELLMQQLHQDLQSVGLTAEDYSLTNLFVLYQDILSRLFDSQIMTLGLVYLAMAIILLLIFRSLKIALIALVPNICTTLGILGLIGWLGVPLDIMTITIAAIAMGIAIDDTIHFVHSYLQAPPNKALQHAFAHTGLAMLFTSVVIATGFAVFGFSGFLPSVYFGLLTAAAMLMALVADLTILPALLKRFVASSARST